MDKATNEVLRQVVLITNRVGGTKRDKYASNVKVPWSWMDRLADAMRAAGIDPMADNLGKDAADRKVAEVQRAHERAENFWEEQRKKLPSTVELDRS